MKIDLINVPLRYGCGKDGVQLAFDKLKANGLFDLIEHSSHSLKSVKEILIPEVFESEMYKYHPKLKYLNHVVNANQHLAETVYKSLVDKNFPIIIGGDHSTGIGSVAAASKYYKNLAVIWIDAHADMNTTDSSISHNIHGMPLAISINQGEKSLTNILFEGQKVKPENVYHIGARDIEPQEYFLAKSLKIEFNDMNKLRTFGLEKSINQIITRINNNNYDGVHLSFDIDVMDPTIAIGTGCPVNKGFDMEEVKIVLTKLLNANLITSIDFVEYNPLLDDKEENTLKTSLEVLEIIINNIQ